MAVQEHEIPETPAVPVRTLYKLLLVLLLVAGIAYSNSFTKSFLLDDVPWITNTEKIKDLWEYVSAMRSRPFFALTLYLNYRIHELSVFGYHLVNLAIHVAASLVLFDLVRRTLLLPRWDGKYAASAHWFAFAIALLWTVHPLQTQAVTYIIQRCESMMGLFFLLTLYLMLRGAEAARPWPWYLGSWVCCLLGAGTKEVMVTALPLVLCYDRFFLATWIEIARRRWWYYVGVAGAIVGMQVWSSLPSLMNPAPTASYGFSIPHLQAPVYWMTQGWVILHYLRLCFYPYPQCFSYRGWTTTTEFGDFWPAGLVIAVLLIVVAWLSLRRHWLGFLGLWFFGILSITSIVPLLDVAFEHRLYLPLAAICVLFVFAGHALVHWLIRFPVAQKMEIAALCLVASVLLVLTMRRNDDYQSVETMWTSVYRLYPNDHEAINNIAVGLERAQKFDEAIEFFKKCPETSPGMATYGLLLCRQDKPTEGLRYMLSALNAPESDSKPEWKGGKHYEVGNAYAILGDSKAAEFHLRKAMEMTPKNPGAYFSMGAVLNQQSRSKEALEYYTSGLRLDAKAPRTRITLARYFLHRYPMRSTWTRKEALFSAQQAAQATYYKEPDALEVLVEAYAANAMYAQAEGVARDAAQWLTSSESETFQAKAAATIAHYRRDESKEKLRAAPTKSN
jgi:tetratricopeptide (TPR) repeat protein